VVVSGVETQAVLDELSNEIDRLNKENAALRQRVQLLTHRLFGQRSEKGLPVIEQRVLPLEPAAAGPVQAETTDDSRQDETAEPASFRRRHPGRRRLPADLPRERIEVVPLASERHCTTCDAAKVRIGADTTEELDYVPASFVIREYMRPKYACASCQQGVVQAALPARPIDKGRPGPGQLAHVVSSKYADHLPLYRLEQMLRQEQALPLLAKLQAYLQEQQAAVLPKSPLGAAIGYALRNWVALTRYTEDGRLKIDNNGAEQALRPIVYLRPRICRLRSARSTAPKDFLVAGRWTTIATHEAPHTRREKRKDDA
jgi:transposase